MKLELRIDTTFAQIALETRLPQVELRTTLPQVQLTTEPPAVVVDIDWPQVELDQTEPLSEIGLKGHLPLARDYAALGQQKTYEAIARMAQHGDALARIEEGRDTSELIAELTWPVSQKELNIGLMPSSPVKVDFHGEIDVSIIPGSLDVDLSGGELDLRAHMGEVKLWFAVAPKVEIDAVGTRYSVWA